MKMPGTCTRSCQKVCENGEDDHDLVRRKDRQGEVLM